MHHELREGANTTKAGTTGLGGTRIQNLEKDKNIEDWDKNYSKHKDANYSTTRCHTINPREKKLKRVNNNT